DRRRVRHQIGRQAEKHRCGLRRAHPDFLQFGKMLPDRFRRSGQPAQDAALDRRIHDLFMSTGPNLSEYRHRLPLFSLDLKERRQLAMPLPAPASTLPDQDFMGRLAVSLAASTDTIVTVRVAQT